MKEISYRIRDAYATLLNPLTVESVVIPIVDNRLNPVKTIPTFKAGKAYIIFKDQNEVNTTNNQCVFRKKVTIGLDVITKYPLNYGGSLASELISEAIQEIIMPSVGVSSVSIAGFQVLDTDIEVDNLFVENGDTETSYIKRLVFSHTIYEL